MLILVGVTIGVAQSGNLFKKAFEASQRYSEAEIEEKLNVLFTEYRISDIANDPVMNYKFLNEILDTFNYPKINESGENVGKLKDEYTNIVAEPGKYESTNEKGEKDLKAYYSLDEYYFKLVYKGKIYKYENQKFENLGDYYIAGNENEWEYTTNDNGTITLTKYLGNGDGNGNLVVPNKLGDKIVSNVGITGGQGNGDNLKLITGKITIENGITMNNNCMNKFLNATVLELKDDISVAGGGTSGSAREINIGDNASLAVNSIINMPNLEKITIGNNLYADGKNFYWSTLQNLPNLTEINIKDNACFDGSFIKTCAKIEKISIGNYPKFKYFYNSGNNIGAFNRDTFNSLVELNIGEINPSDVWLNSFDGCTNIKRTNCPFLYAEYEDGTIGLTLAFVCEENGDMIIPNTYRGKTVKGSFVKNLASKRVTGTLIVSDGVNVGAVNNSNFPNIKNIILKDNTSAGISGLTLETLEIGNNVTLQNGSINNISGLTSISIGDNFKSYSDFYSGTFQNMTDLETITIGKNAEISGNIARNSNKIKTISIGENSKLIDIRTSGQMRGFIQNANSVENVIIGKNSRIDSFAFQNCKNTTIQIYLNEEQKLDNTKITTGWINQTGTTFTRTIDSEKATFTPNPQN